MREPFTLFSLVLLSFTVLLGGVAHARADERRSATLSLFRDESAQGCIDIAGMARDVAERLQRDPWVSPTQATLFIDASITRRAAGYHVRIHSRDVVSGEEGVREIDLAGEDCRAHDEALALALSLMVDPDSVAMASSAVVPAPAAVPPQASTPPVLVASARPSVSEAAFAATASVLMQLGYGASFSPGLSLRVSYAPSSLISLELAGNYVVLPGSADAMHGAAVDIVSVTPFLCTTLWRPSSFRFRTCYGAELARVSARGIGYEQNAEGARGMVNAVLAARLRWLFTTHFGMELSVGISLSPIRPEIVGTLSDGALFTHYKAPLATALFELSIWGGELL